MKKLKHRSNLYKKWQYRLKIRLKHKEEWESFLRHEKVILLREYVRVK